MYIWLDYRCLQGFILTTEIVSIESEIISIFVRICRLDGVILPYQTKRSVYYVYTKPYSDSNVYTKLNKDYETNINDGFCIGAI